ncbi:MAG: DMT family transporter, partial [Bacillota bacterium]|nr:DMT family transporter [Bacillota bacterium]
FTITKGDLWVLACAFLFSCHILVTDHFVSQVDPIQMSLLQFIVATVLSWIFAVTLETPQWSAIWDARVAIIYCGVFSGGVGYTLQILGQKYAEPTSASLAMSLESVFAAIGGWLILNEVMSGKELLGAGLMFLAIILVQIKIRK